MPLNQGDPGLDRGGDQGADQTAGTGAYDHQVGIEAPGFAEAAQYFARLQPGQYFSGDQRKQAQQREGGDQGRRQDAAQAQGVDLAQLRAGIHVDSRTQEHAELTHPVESPGPQGRHRHRQIHGEERKRRHQPQSEQIKCAVLLNTPVDGGQGALKARTHGIAKQIAGDNERQGGAEGTGEGHDDHSHRQTEQGAGDECEQRGPR